MKEKISIIIPVYNQEKNIKNCIDSLKKQKIEELEFIFVNDASTDHTLDILYDFKAEDCRVMVIDLPQNSGTSVARKQGVLASTGKYIMFLDSDDMLEEDACQIVYEEMEKDPVDILQFGTNVKMIAKVERNVYHELVRQLKPYIGKCKEKILEQCFEKQKWGYALWNKAYNAEVCRLAFQHINDNYMVMAEDLYAFFLISFFSQSYRGIDDKLYRYNYGEGITGSSQHVDYKEFNKYCTMFRATEAIHDFLSVETEKNCFHKIEKKLARKFSEDIVYQWKEFLSIADAKKGYDLMIRIMGAEAVISAMAKLYWDKSPELLERITKRYDKKMKGKNVQHIGVYYQRLYNGGAEKVISLLIPIWINMGYEVILITDEKPHKYDYPIPACVAREVIHDFRKSESANYKKRAKGWNSIITKYAIDTMVYSSYNCPTIMWDVCMLKGLNCNVIVETHSVFSSTIWYSPLFASYLPQIYKLVDRVVALSTVDVTFWKNFCPAYYIPNPLELTLNQENSGLDSKNILWVGRISPEKRPEAILEAFEIVHQKIPDIKLTIVGSGDSEHEIEILQNKAYEMQIDRNVEFTGFQKNVGKYYKDASMLVMTSLCEGFPMVLAESKCYGLPTVMYELPNLEMVKDSGSVISVPQNDVFSLAEKIVQLLLNNELRNKMGKQARIEIEKFLNADVEGKWREVFESFNYEIEPDDFLDRNESLMLELLFKDFFRGATLLASSAASTQTGGLSDIYNRLNIYEEVLGRHEEVVNRHEEVVNRHEEVVNRHEEVVNRHEEVVNRHEKVINDDWAWLKDLEERVSNISRSKGIRAFLKK